MTLTTFALVRHGQTDWNAERRLQGSTDIPLNDVGRGQARDAAAVLSPYEWDAIVSSPLSRAAETADLIAEGLGLTVSRRVPELTERSFGPAEGMQAGPGTGRAADPGRLQGRRERGRSCQPRPRSPGSARRGVQRPAAPGGHARHAPSRQPEPGHRRNPAQRGQRRAEPGAPPRHRRGGSSNTSTASPSWRPQPSSAATAPQGSVPAAGQRPAWPRVPRSTAPGPRLC